MNPPSQQRKKVWEVDGSYKCSLIGTCLGRAELRRLSRERVFEIEPGLDDYQLHSRFIGISTRDDIQGRTLHKYLEKKYRQQTKKYLQASTEVEMRICWEGDLAEGRVDSAWWGIMTHPLASAELVGQLYGFLHMLGHKYASGYQKEQAQRTALRTKVAMLEEILGSERQHHRWEQSRRNEERAVFEKERAAHSAMAKENLRLRAANEVLNQRIHELTAAGEQQESRQVVAALRQENIGFHDQLDEQSRELKKLQQQLAEAMVHQQKMEMEKVQMMRQLTDPAQEFRLSANTVRQRLSETDPCAVCADQNTTQCPGLSLCGKTILYVGGLHKMVPHYRQLVEHLGGQFMHHDGGKEASRSLLPKMLVTADAVFCPIDCVSHDACKQVKKMCKRYRKPFVLMRSSGLSSLAKGLNEIVQ
jgi:hypothetical protein